MTPQGRCLLVLLISLQLLLLLFSHPVGIVRGYPTHTLFNEESILNNETWGLFVGINGFDNTPNATARYGDNVTVEWNDENGFAHHVLLVEEAKPVPPEWEFRVMISYTKLNDTGYELFNKTVTSMIFDTSSDEYTLTAFIDGNDNTHIFWLREYCLCDHNMTFWLYHETLAMDGEVLVSAELFYFEIQTNGLEIHFPYWVFLLPLLVALTLVIVVINRIRRKK